VNVTAPYRQNVNTCAVMLLGNKQKPTLLKY